MARANSARGLLIEQSQLKKLCKLNYEFHMLIYRAPEMPQLLHLIRTLWTKFPWDTLNVIPRSERHVPSGANLFPQELLQF